MASVHEFLLPDLGEGLTEAEIVEWLVSVGDEVSLNQDIVEVETAKASVMVPSPFAGRLVERFGEPGESLAVGQVLCRLESSPAPHQLLVGYGATDARPMTTPPVRKLAKDLGVNLTSISPGSGPGGVITRQDVHTAAAQRCRPAGDSPDRPPAERGLPPGFRGRRPGETESVKGIRKRIIATMEKSRGEIPDASCSRDADFTALWNLRRELTAAARAEGVDVMISPLVVVCRAAIVALRRFPTLNARYDREAGEIHLLEPINLGIAVDTDRGLLVPNIKNAHRTSTLELAAAATELAARCRDGSIRPEELTGGTFTVDNYGSFGNDDGNPIINPPEAAMLGIGAIRERPWVHQGQVAVRLVGRLTLAFDHRICDGGEAGRFVTYVADLCEHPARILLHC